MTQVVIQGQDIASERDLHDALASVLDFGPYYGNNLPALWDRLSTDVPRPVKIVWLNAAASRERLGSELFEQIVDLLEDARRQDADAGLIDRFDYEIVEAT